MQPNNLMQVSKIMQQHQLHDIEATDANGDTVLHLIVSNEKLTSKEKVKFLRILLDKGLNPKVENRRGRTVLHLAIAKRLKNVIDLLITHKLALNSTAAAYMIEGEHENYHKLKSQWETNGMLQKAECESAEFVEWIIIKGLDIDEMNYIGRCVTFGCSLLLAINYNLLHILPTLLKYTSNIRYVQQITKSTLLHIFLESNASERSKYESHRDEIWYLSYTERYATNIVKILLDNGLSPEAVDEHGDTGLHVAIDNKENISIIQMLIDRSKNVNHKNNEGKTPFYIAIDEWLRFEDQKFEYYMRIWIALIVKGANVNEQDNYGTSSLCNAVQWHNLQVVEFLRDNGADFGVIAENGDTLMHLLASKAHLQTNKEIVIKLFGMLISNGCESNAKNDDGNTPLHIAAIHNNVILVKKLIALGANVNCRNKRMETPLYCLATKYNAEKTDVAELLLEHGANVNVKDIEGSTALETSKYMTVEMLQFLLKHGMEFDTGVSFAYLDLENRMMNEAASLVYRLKHCIKLHVAKLKRLSRYAYENIIEREEYKKYYKKCLKEIETLKTSFIDSRTSLYSLLHINLNKRRAYLYNEKLQQLLDSSELEKKYPEFSILIYSSYHEAATRNLLLEPAKQAWLELTKIRLPEECVELIFSFLRNSDLYDVIQKN